MRKSMIEINSVGEQRELGDECEGSSVEIEVGIGGTWLGFATHNQETGNSGETFFPLYQSFIFLTV